MLTVTSHANENIVNRAFSALSDYYDGKKAFQVIKPKHYLSIRISLRWRLLSKDKGHRWELMTHERYNKQIKF